MHLISGIFPSTIEKYVVQDQAKSTARKIEDLRKRSSVEKHKREFLLLCNNGEDSAKITLQEEKLQELSHKIHQLQCEDMLQDKVLYFLATIRSIDTHFLLDTLFVIC